MPMGSLISGTQIIWSIRSDVKIRAISSRNALGTVRNRSQETTNWADWLLKFPRLFSSSNMSKLLNFAQHSSLVRFSSW